MYINKNSQKIRPNPSLNITFLETSTFFTIPNKVTANITTAGIIIILKIALPEVVPIPKAKLSNSPSIIRLKSVVKSSGIELPIAFIVAPLTPSVKFRPR